MLRGLLEPPPEDWQAQPPTAFASVARPFLRSRTEPAGHAYDQLETRVRDFVIEQRRLAAKAARRAARREARRSKAAAGGAQGRRKGRKRRGKKGGKGKRGGGEQDFDSDLESSDDSDEEESRKKKSQGDGDDDDDDDDDDAPAARRVFSGGRGPGVAAIGEQMDWDEWRKMEVGPDDFYGLLNLSHLHVFATPDDLAKAYKRASLTVHPDKAAPEDRDRFEERFKNMQRAYEELCDPDKRVVYDSGMDFDESVPKKDEGTTDETFFEAYGPVFLRNAQFSLEPAVPALGDMDTPIAEVDKFYDFWLKFKTWRVIKHDEEYNLEEADSREERRWMARENVKMRKKLQKDEVKRVYELAKDALSKDPRIRREKERIREEREARKRERAEAKRRKADEARLAREEEERKAEEEKRREEERKEEQKRQTAKARQWRKDLRAALGDGTLAYKPKKKKNKKKKAPELDRDMLDDVMKQLSYVQMAEIIMRLDPAHDPEAVTAVEEAREAFAKGGEDAENPGLCKDSSIGAGQLVVAHHLRLEAEKAAARAEYEAEIAKRRLEKRKQEEALRNAKEWTLEEESMLAKAIIKVPGGSKQRWDQITEMVNQISHTTRKTKEVIRKAKTLNTKGKRVAGDLAFKQYKKTMTNVPDATDGPTPAAPIAAAAAAPTVRDIADVQPAVLENGDDKKTKKKKKKKNVWSAEQQDALEHALKSVPKGDDRWDKIAELVPGKTKKQCVKRFKEIRQAILKAKQG